MKYYERITNARQVLGIPEYATLADIKHRYHTLMKSIHPDVSGKDMHVSQEESIRINDSYEIIMQYCEKYRLSFTEDEVNKYRPAEELWFEKFGDDPTC
ncbi:J domain-containing protein [bacterium]|nr:J domain-containing protein [bacterium]